MERDREVNLSLFIESDLLGRGGDFLGLTRRVFCQRLQRTRSEEGVFDKTKVLSLVGYRATRLMWLLYGRDNDECFLFHLEHAVA